MPALPGVEPLAQVLTEELGCVLQVSSDECEHVMAAFDTVGLPCEDIGAPRGDGRVRLQVGDTMLIDAARADLQRRWSSVSHRMQRLRDNPRCADEELEAVDAEDTALFADLAFDVDEDVAAPFIATGVRPRVAILREQGINGHVEMAAAFHAAGFTPVDVHVSDVRDGRDDLADYSVLAACGGFSYGDVLGAGGGWARSIRFNERLRETFARYFERDQTLTLGVCNGCQMLAELGELIPGAHHWPRFVVNDSQQFEARVALLRIEPSPSLLLAGMAGSILPVAVAHGEGRAEQLADGVCARYVDGTGEVTLRYPFNPNGSPEGIAGLSSSDGRVTIMMPHPERVYRSVTNSWHPPEWGEFGPWMRLFRNARAAVA